MFQLADQRSVSNQAQRARCAVGCDTPRQTPRHCCSVPAAGEQLNHTTRNIGETKPTSGGGGGGGYPSGTSMPYKSGHIPRGIKR